MLIEILKQPITWGKNNIKKIAIYTTLKRPIERKKERKYINKQQL